MNSSSSESILFNGYIGSVLNISALRQYSTARLNSGAHLLVDGNVSRGDGNGGAYVFDLNSTAVDDGLTVVAPLSGAGRWLLAAGKGLKGDTGPTGPVGATGATGPQGEGLADISTTGIVALKGAATTVPQTFLTGRVTAGDAGQGQFVWVAGDQSGPVTADPLGGLWVAPNADPTGHSGAWARVWDGVHGRPEWFGARINDGNFDNRPCFDACLALCPTMLLGPFDYFIQGTWTIATSYRTIVGTGRNGGGPNPSTRIILNGASVSTAHAILLGTPTSPGAINSFTSNIHLKSLTVVINSGPAVPTGGITSGQACIKASYVLRITCEEVDCVNGNYAFYMGGVVYSQIKDCSGSRTALDTGATGGTPSANDFFVGLLLDGTPDIGGNTGIASFYCSKLSVNGDRATIAKSYGVYTGNGITDLFVEKVETSQINFGAVLNGAPSKVYGSEDGWLRDCVFDQCDGGIIVNAAQADEAITIQGNYVATNFNLAGAQAFVYNGTPTSGIGGSVSLIGNQFLGGGTAGNAGMFVTTANGLIAKGNIWTDFSSPFQIVSAKFCHISDRISNPTVAVPNAAVVVVGSGRIVFDNIFDGMNGVYPSAYKIISDCVAIEVRTTGVDLGCLAGSDTATRSGNKIHIDGNSVALTDGFTSFPSGIGIALGMAQ